MTFMRYAYLFAAVAAVVLACTVPYWLPPEWARKKTKVRHSTEGSGFPFDLFSSADPNNERAASSSAPFPGSNSENNNKNNQQSKEDVFPFKVGAGTVKVFSKEELSQYVSNPLYLVVLGEVFDVTTGERFYAKGSGYHCFIGKDNSAAFHTGKFNDTQEDIRGLKNLGNTCYMNATMQCLVRVPRLYEYFLNGDYVKELIKTNKLGFGGQLAAEFSNVVRELFSSGSVSIYFIFS